jgi:hypothetical protein
VRILTRIPAAILNSLDPAPFFVPIFPREPLPLAYGADSGALRPLTFSVPPLTRDRSGLIKCGVASGGGGGAEGATASTRGGSCRRTPMEKEPAHIFEAAYWRGCS